MYMRCEFVSNAPIPKENRETVMRCTLRGTPSRRARRLGLSTSVMNALSPTPLRVFVEKPYGKTIPSITSRLKKSKTSHGKVTTGVRAIIHCRHEDERLDKTRAASQKGSGEESREDRERFARHTIRSPISVEAQMSPVDDHFARIAEELRGLKADDKAKKLNEYLGKPDHTMKAKLKWNAQLMTTLRVMKVWPPV